MILGVTGCPGSGKSLLSGTMERAGWCLIDADLIGREVVGESRDMVDALASAFGEDIITPEGILDRRLVAKRAFANPAETAKLNSIVHPELIRWLSARIQEQRSRGEQTVVDCALIFEWGIEASFDLVVCVQADREKRIDRIVRRDGRTQVEVKRFFGAQLPEAEKVRRSDLVLSNNGSVERLESMGLLLCHLPAVLKGNSAGE